ncbi:hypothetical protein ACFTZB_11845 [Rhodococcus sp. NPDC057014]|uniref:hypothetical protein n=1 Tax=Rhodococcus sp. NPDC057014 TaxID=3346000 RepID=UPI00363468FA
MRDVARTSKLGDVPKASGVSGSSSLGVETMIRFANGLPEALTRRQTCTLQF